MHSTLGLDAVLIFLCAALCAARRAMPSSASLLQDETANSKIMPQIFGPTSAPVKLLAVGDSLTAGWNGQGRGIFEPYAKALQHTLGDNVQVVVDGISGGTVSEFVQKAYSPVIAVAAAQSSGPGIATLLAHYDFKLCLIMGGTNDLGYGMSGALIENLKRLHGYCHDAGVESVAISIPPAQQDNPLRRTINSQLAAWCESVPMCRLFVSSGSYLQQWDDGLHFFPAEYTKLGEGLAQQLGPLLKDEDDESNGPIRLRRRAKDFVKSIRHSLRF